MASAVKVNVLSPDVIPGFTANHVTKGSTKLAVQVIFEVTFTIPMLLSAANKVTEFEESNIVGSNPGFIMPFATLDGTCLFSGVCLEVTACKKELPPKGNNINTNSKLIILNASMAFNNLYLFFISSDLSDD